MSDEKAWPGKRDLYEMIQRLEEKLTENTCEQIKTQGKIDKYNGLLEKIQKQEEAIHACQKDILIIKTEEAAKVKQLKSIKGWVSFGVTVITALIAWGVLG